MEKKVLEKGAEEIIEENDDEFKNTPDPEVDPYVIEPSGEEDIDKSGEDKGDGEGAGKDEEGEKIDEPEVSPEITELREQNKALQERLDKLESTDHTPKPEFKPLNDEEWSKLEESRGIPRAGQEWIINSIVHAVQQAISHATTTQLTLR